MDDDAADHMMLMSAMDQIASDRRCEHRQGRCLYSSALYNDCDCLKAAVARVRREESNAQGDDSSPARSAAAVARDASGGG